MAWDRNRSIGRIERYLAGAPELDNGISLASQRPNSSLVIKSSLEEYSPRKAFVVEGAHLYGHLIDYDRLVFDSSGRETEQTHEALLRFLDAQYRLWDAVVEYGDAERVDYHGTRLHAVVSDSEGSPEGQIQKAVALAQVLSEATRSIAQTLGVPGRVRFGVDQGKCLALTTGRNHDRDILFLGKPANYAAKLAAAAQTEGVFISPRASSNMRRPATFDRKLELDEIRSASNIYRFDSLSKSALAIAREQQFPKRFQFFEPTLPLADMKFEEVFPSHTARLRACSIFADVDKFTAFVDAAIEKGSNAIREAAIGIHVIREELNSVLKTDFSGKRIRFIGDCIHGVLAKGDGESRTASTLHHAAMCASAMQSSFDLCKTLVPGVSSLGLAIGIEFGQVPITRF
ncbi:MAG: hypothetical protein IPM06_15880 [Rhizobiales bacterium]|nr:hypothetical protein [Hyphomicrobiales bacterium]